MQAFEKSLLAVICAAAVLTVSVPTGASSQATHGDELETSAREVSALKVYVGDRIDGMIFLDDSSDRYSVNAMGHTTRVAISTAQGDTYKVVTIPYELDRVERAIVSLPSRTALDLAVPPAHVAPTESSVRAFLDTSYYCYDQFCARTTADEEAEEVRHWGALYKYAQTANYYLHSCKAGDVYCREETMKTHISPETYTFMEWKVCRNYNAVWPDTETVWTKVIRNKYGPPQGSSASTLAVESDAIELWGLWDGC